MKKKLQIALLIIDFFLVILNIAVWINQGYFRDIFPQAVMRGDIEIFFLIALPVTVIVFIVDVYFLIKSKETAHMSLPEKIISIVIVLAFLLHLYYGYAYLQSVTPYWQSLKEDYDYISSEYLRGIQLDELKLELQSEEPSLLYIGREDCGECVEFEKSFEPLLEKYYTEIPVYYTSIDRDGPRSQEMYEVLDEYQIDSVPIVILMKENKLIEKWENPIEELDEIEKYL